MNDLKQTLIRNRKPLLIISSVVAAVFLFLGSSIISLAHNKMEFKRLKKHSARLDAQYEQQQAEYALLDKQDPAHIERLARVKYNMSKPGEIEFRFKN